MEALMPVARQSQCTPRAAESPEQERALRTGAYASLDSGLPSSEICGKLVPAVPKLIQITAVGKMKSLDDQRHSSVIGGLVRMGHQEGDFTFSSGKGHSGSSETNEDACRSVHSGRRCQPLFKGRYVVSQCGVASAVQQSESAPCTRYTSPPSWASTATPPPCRSSHSTELDTWALEQLPLAILAPSWRVSPSESTSLASHASFPPPASRPHPFLISASLFLPYR